MMQKAGVSAAHADATQADFGSEHSRWIDALRGAVRSGNAAGLLVLGPVGTGKTRFAVAAMRYWLLSGRKAEFMLGGQLMRRIWGTYRDDSRVTEDEILDRLTALDLLVIDDMGREGRTSEAVKRIFHEVLSRRIDNFRPVIVTTNLSLDEIGEVYGDAIQSRLANLDQVPIIGADRRAT